jgi:hypothetical protein
MLTSLFEKATSHKPNTMEAVLRSMVSRSPNGVVNIAPGIAQRILEELNFPGQRPVDSSRVYGHRHAIITGDWLDGHAITFAALPDGQILLVDGQHRLTAIGQSESAIPITVRIVPVEGVKDAQRFYAGFDQKKSVRTDRQILDAVGVAEETVCVYQAAPLLLNDLEPLTGSANIKRTQTCSCITTKWRSCKGGPKKHASTNKSRSWQKRRCCRECDLPAFLPSRSIPCRHQPARAREFWMGLAEHDGLRKTTRAQRFTATS